MTSSHYRIEKSKERESRKEKLLELCKGEMRKAGIKSEAVGIEEDELMKTVPGTPLGFKSEGKKEIHIQKGST